MSIYNIQLRLKHGGFYNGAIDGDFGPRSLAAIIAEKRHQGVPVPPWLPIAAAELGVKEASGPADNPRVVEYHKTTELGATDDEVPWCSSFVNWCIERAGLKGTRSALASSWINWGFNSEDAFGSVAVLRRTGGNHVAFLVEASQDSLLLLGGNQSDSVCVAQYNRATLRSFRMHAYAPQSA